jgi:alpha-mannosidase
MTSGELSLSIDPAGNVRLASPLLPEAIDHLVRFEDVPDVGDLYTHSPGASVSTHATFVGAHVVHRGPLRGTIEGRWRLRIPTNATVDRDPAELATYAAPAPNVPVPNSGVASLEVAVAMTLDAGSDMVRFEVRGENVAADHRLRIVFAAPVPDPAVWADAAFGPVHRVPIIVDDRDREMETPPRTAPLHRYVTIAGEQAGVTIASDGLAEYEALDGAVAITLLRAVGELSRNDLPERPGHAGWPVSVPLAQCLGPFEARFAYLVHGPRTAETTAAIERATEDFLLPLTGTTLRSALALPEPTRGAELLGEGLAFSAVKESEDGKAIVLRCINLLDTPVDGRWSLAFPVRAAHLARLDETPLDSLDVAGREIAFVAHPRAVVTIRVS